MEKKEMYAWNVPHIEERSSPWLCMVEEMNHGVLFCRTLWGRFSKAFMSTGSSITGALFYTLLHGFVNRQWNVQLPSNRAQSFLIVLIWICPEYSHFIRFGANSQRPVGEHRRVLLLYCFVHSGLLLCIGPYVSVQMYRWNVSLQTDSHSLTTTKLAKDYPTQLSVHWELFLTVHDILFLSRLLSSLKTFLLFL